MTAPCSSRGSEYAICPRDVVGILAFTTTTSGDIIVTGTPANTTGALHSIAKGLVPLFAANRSVICCHLPLVQFHLIYQLLLILIITRYLPLTLSNMSPNKGYLFWGILWWMDLWLVRSWDQAQASPSFPSACWPLSTRISTATLHQGLLMSIDRRAPCSVLKSLK